jgi:hypothetical protein
MIEKGKILHAIREFVEKAKDHFRRDTDHAHANFRHQQRFLPKHVRDGKVNTLDIGKQS